MKKYLLFIVLIFFAFQQIALSQINNIQVNDPENSNYPPNEVTIAINPANPSQLAGGANIKYFYSSNDGGFTWTQTLLTSSLGGVYGDPVVIYDGLGNLYYSHLNDGRNLGSYWLDKLVVQRSTDNGSTWAVEAGVGYNPPIREQDKEWMAVDLADSPYKNNIYMSWTEFDSYGSTSPDDSTRILFSRSTDQGLTWSAPIRLSDKLGNCIDEDSTVEGAVPTIGPNGEVYVSWSGPEGIVFDKSADGGLTFGTDIFVTEHRGGWDFAVSGIYRCNGMPITACDTSNSAYRGHIYILWGEQESEGTNSDVYIIKSTNGGNTWGQKVRVNNDNTTRHQFFPWMAIDQSNGYIYSIFYDRRNTIGDTTEVTLARSVDGGATFQNYIISDAPFSPTDDIFFGDYTNIAAMNGTIHPIWMELEDYTMSIWTAVIDDTDLITDVEEENNNNRVITDYELIQNYPNPFNPSTTITYKLPAEGYVTLKVYDILGAEIATLVNEYKPRGEYDVTFSGNNLPSGMYIYRLTVDKHSYTKKMILVK